MAFFSRDSDSDLAFRLQLEEALEASRSQRQPSPPHPPVVATSGYAVVAQETDRSGSKTTGDVRNVNRGFDFRRAIGEGNSRGKGKIYETVRRDERNPNIGVGNIRNPSGDEIRRPSPVICSRDSVRSGPAAQLVGEGSSRVNSAAGKLDGNVLYRLYSKGLVTEGGGNGKMVMESVAGFGVAICDQRDNLLFETKGPLVERGTNRQGAEIIALTRGLTEALKLGIKRIAICCDSYPIFQFVTGKWVPKQRKVSLLLDDLHRIRQQFPVSQPVLVAGKDVKFAYRLARGSLMSPESHQATSARKEECAICFNDVDADRMFSVDRCRHRFCFQCVKQHVEVKLLHGMVPKCPHDGCKSELVIDSCVKLLTPKLSELWKQRIKENAVPVTERVYCPYPKCSALMSKSKISESAKSLLSLHPNSGVRRCVECRGLFCVDCKVPWHGKLSCTEYKKLHPNPPADDVKLKSLANNEMWRQCNKCQHMIELTEGCNHITCRCGNEFCYKCGAAWKKGSRTCTKGCQFMDEAYIIRQHPHPPHVFMAPNNYFDDDDDEEDNDYGYDDFFPLHFGEHYMNNANPEEEPFDPFFDLPDGVLFTPDMLSPKTRQRFYLSDSDDTDEETGQQPPHLRHYNDINPFGNATSVGFPWADDDDPYFGKYGKYALVYDSDGYEIEDYTNPFHPDYPHF